MVTDTIILETNPSMAWTGSTPADNAWIQGNNFASSLDIFATGLANFTRNRNGTGISVYDSGLVLMANFDRVQGIGEGAWTSNLEDVSIYNHGGNIYNTSWTSNGKY